LTVATGAPAARSIPAAYAFEGEKRQHLTAACGAPKPLVGLVGYAFEAERRQHLVYQGADRHIHELAISMP
jgi:hypothetical protein